MQQTIGDGFQPSSRCRPRIIARWIGAAVLAAGALAHADGSATSGAASAGDSATNNSGASELQEIVVTGSLIPTTKAETATPVTTISVEDIQSKGFADIAEALQRASYATGSVQNGQYLGFTPGAKVISLFGLSPSYTKYLIDGRPIADYPALYNGTDIIVSISGIPTQLIDKVDILPGAQSSIYGSDAIAGVVNVKMKQTLDGPMIDGRYGWTKDGGGTDRRIAVADGFSIGRFNLIAGAQYESVAPIFGYQRALTSQFYPQGSSPQIAERDFLLYGVYGQANGNTYYFEDPANCANVAGLFYGTVGVRSRTNRGEYCGTYQSGFYTINNGDESTQGYLHATLDVNDYVQLFADTLVNHDAVRFNSGALAFNGSFDASSPYGYYEDPNLGPDYLNLQHTFSPEEAGGLNNITSKNTNNSIRGTFGAKGSFATTWKYITDFTYTKNKLTEATHLQFTSPIEAFFANIFGPQLGFDPVLGAYEYSPNYANFYKPITAAQYNAFSGDAISYSYTEESLARAQLTNTALFPLPGGDAGLAVQVEGGDQGWNYAPDPRYLDNETFGYTSTAGSGHRSRYAGTVELQMPVLSMVTADVSGRYDDYKVLGQNVDKGTYNLSLQFQPIKQFLLRGRYGTAFKAPTLSDEFQGVSGFYENLTDYYTCAKEGYTGASIGNCPQFLQSTFGSTSGNPKLAPITAKVWDIGTITQPIDDLQIAIDYIHWAIRDEVASADPDKLLQQESACRLGQLDPTSPTCLNALANVTRNSAGAIVSVYTPKQNVSQENLSTVVVGINYRYDAGYIGRFEFESSFTDMVTHSYQQYIGDPLINDLNNPFYSTEFKTKGNGSITWTKNPLSATVYVERYGRSPQLSRHHHHAGLWTAGCRDGGPLDVVRHERELQADLVGRADVCGEQRVRPHAARGSQLHGRSEPALRSVQLQRLRAAVLRLRQLQDGQVIGAGSRASGSRLSLPLRELS